MYNAHFGFREKPFAVTPDPRFFFGSPIYREAYASLVLGIRERKGFIVMTGEVGTGKTLLLRMLMNNLEATVRFVFIYNTTLTFEEVLSFTCEELGLSGERRGRLEQIQRLNRFLIEQLSKGGTAALLIDEAQHLSEEALENLRLLSNLETGTEKLLQIVLVGQPELQPKLARPELRALKQRVSVQCQLAHLPAPEVAAYIQHRLRLVGYEGSDLFAPGAVKSIAQYSGGIPRLINNICDNALTIGYATSRRKISADIVHEVVRDLQLDLPRRPTNEETTARRLAPAIQAIQLRQPTRRREPARGESSPSPVEAAASPAWVATDSLADREPDRLWASILAILCLFALGGAGLYALHAGVPLGAPRAADVPRLDAAAAPAAVPAPPEVRPAAAERPGPSTDTDTGARVENSTLPSWPPIPPLATAVHSETHVVKAGSTATAIARETYGPSLLLGLSLMKESNPHLEDLNWVLVGQKLRLLPLTRGTLMRRVRDGSHSLLLTALPTEPAAERLARAVRAAEYQVVITPQWISDGLTLHRVEIAALKGTTEADGAWETAVANRWIGYADDPTGR